MIAALRALVALATPDALPALVSAATDGSAEVRRLALEGLIALGDDRALAVLPGDVRDADAGVRARAARLAARRGAGGEATLPLLADPDPEARRHAVRAVGRAGGAGGPRALLDALPRLAGLELEVGQALEASARPADLGRLQAALDRASGSARAAVLMGVVGALVRAPSGAVPGLRGLVRRLEVELEGPVFLGELAADALAAAVRAGAEPSSTLAVVFGRLAPSVRARLCPALVADRAGLTRVLQSLEAPFEDDEVRTAAARSLAGLSAGRARAALEAARRSGHPAVAGTAAAALAAGARGRRTVGVRVVAPTGGALARQWVTFALPTGGAIGSRTDLLGHVRLFDLPDGGALPGAAAVTVGALGAPEIVLEHPRDGVWQVPRGEVARP
jgi:HEAT repeat protein